MTDRISFNRAYPLGKEVDYASEAISSGRIGSGGKFGDAAEQCLRDRFNGSDVLLTSSCTDALEMAALLANVAPGDEVILPSFTFVSTVNAFCLRGATPRFVDIEPEWLNIDPEKIEAAISPKTKAIVPVHYAGVPSDMKKIIEIANRHGLTVIEDAAQALGSLSGGTQVGLDGAMSALSFHETKNVSCGEGGALVINDPALVERARILRDKGTNRHDFALGRVDMYTWVDTGSSFG
ncbi:MAG: aminotransferase class V-fold PLP-dependent enzyme, partial [Boseongicola sp.]